MADFRALNKKFNQRYLRRLKRADPWSCYLQNYWKLYHNVHNSNSSPALIYNITGFSRKAPFTLLLGGAKKANVKRRKSPSTSLLLPHQEPGLSGPKQFIFGVSEIPRETIISFVTFFSKNSFFRGTFFLLAQVMVRESDFLDWSPLLWRKLNEGHRLERTKI